MSKDVLIVNTNGSCLCTEVNQYTAGAAFGVGKHAVGQGQRREIHFCNGNACVVKAFVDVPVEVLFP